MNLIECLLRIADTGLYSTVLEIFKHGIQRSGELIFLGLLQLSVNYFLIFCKLEIKFLSFLDCMDHIKTRIITINHSNISCY